MPRVELVIPDAECERFEQEAQKAGMTLEGWLIAAAWEWIIDEKKGPSRGEPRKKMRPFKSRDEMWAFFSEISARHEPEREPDWEEHLRVMDESRRKGLPDV